LELWCDADIYGKQLTANSITDNIVTYAGCQVAWA